MKLLLDHNLPPSLINSFSNLYPGSLHVRNVGLDRASDSEIWAYAAKHKVASHAELLSFENAQDGSFMVRSNALPRFSRY